MLVQHNKDKIKLYLQTKRYAERSAFTNSADFFTSLLQGFTFPLKYCILILLKIHFQQNKRKLSPIGYNL